MNSSDFLGCLKIVMKCEIYRYFKEYYFLETGGSNSLEKAGKNYFVRGKFLIVSEVKIQTGTPEKRWFKTDSYIAHGPVTLLWIKYNNQNKKFITIFIKNLPSKYRDFYFSSVQMPHHQK